MPKTAQTELRCPNCSSERLIVEIQVMLDVTVERGRVDGVEADTRTTRPMTTRCDNCGRVLRGVESRDAERLAENGRWPPIVTR